MVEEWRVIEGCSRYDVSNFWRVRSRVRHEPMILKHVEQLAEAIAYESGNCGPHDPANVTFARAVLPLVEAHDAADLEAAVSVVRAEMRAQWAADVANVQAVAEAQRRDAIGYRAECDALREKVARVEALHEVQIEMGVQPWCEADGKPWPCPTVRALAGELCTHLIHTYTDGETPYECLRPATHELLDLTGNWAPVCDAHGRGSGVSEDRLRALTMPTPLPSDQQRRLDNLPCPNCGGDRLRPNFRDPNACHVARPAPVVTPSAEPVHWIGDAPTSLHGNGAASFTATSRHWQSVTCTLCLSLRPVTPSTEGSEP